jgi:hypothetical protein
MQTSAAAAVTVGAYSAGKRKLLEDITDEEEHVPYSSCTRALDCAPSFENPAICRSLWDGPMPCYSCSERIHGNSTAAGYACNPRSKKCECSPPIIIDPEDERERPDDAEWRGDSWCDTLMRAYKYQAIRSPLENAWVFKCSKQREFGMKLMHWLGLHTVPPDVLYNPVRLLWVGKDIAEGVYVYFAEEWGKDDRDIGAFFDRLIELKIDPILTFKALDLGQKTMAAVTAVIGEVDVIGIMTQLIDIVDEDAAVLFENGVNKTATVFNGITAGLSRGNACSVLADIITATTSTVPAFDTLVRASMSSNTTNSS